MSIFEILIYLSIIIYIIPHLRDILRDDTEDTEDTYIDNDYIDNTFCLQNGNICENRCDNLHGQEIKRTLNLGLLNEDSNIFQAEDCSVGTKLRDLQSSSVICGIDGEVDCGSDDCCIPKTCEYDLSPIDDDDGDIYNAYNVNYPGQDKIIKRRRDGNCPYQQTVKLDELCNGIIPGVGGDCTRDTCCEDKTCVTHWDSTSSSWNNDIPECPSNADKGKLSDETPCDFCDESECCYEPSNFCSVTTDSTVIGENPNNLMNGANTNINNVTLDGTPDLTDPSLEILGKDNISIPAQQQRITDAITCNDNYQYGMCEETPETDGTCSNYDNNQRLCEENGCSFPTPAALATTGNKPRIDFSDCMVSDADGPHNTIRVGNCIDTCTANKNLIDTTDASLYFFDGAPFDSADNSTPSAINNLYDNIVDSSGERKNYTSDDFYSGSHTYFCNSYGGSGSRNSYNYQCEGGGSYFSVDDLSNCTSTCRELYSDGTGEGCPNDKVYDSTTNDDPATYESFHTACCIAKTCNNGSGGNPIACPPYQRIIDSTGDASSQTTIDRGNCCEQKSCTDFMNEYNSLNSDSGETKTDQDICVNGIFRGDRLLDSRYLYQLSPIYDGNNLIASDNNANILERFEDYRQGSAEYDIGCCSQITCGEWLNENISTLNLDEISDVNDVEELQAVANQACGSGFFSMDKSITNIDTGDLTSDNPCCMSNDNIECTPTSDLTHATVDSLSNRGYIVPDLETRFGEIEFEVTGSSYTSVETGPTSDITCASGYDLEEEGIRLHCVPGPAAEPQNKYYLTGCNPSSPDETVITQAQCSSEIAIVDNDGKRLLCNLPDSGVESGIDITGFIFGEGGVVDMNSFRGQLNNISCNESTETPCFTSCGNSFDSLAISGCHYKDLPSVEGTNFYSDRYFTMADHRTGANKGDGADCGSLYTKTNPETYEALAEDDPIRIIINEIKDYERNNNNSEKTDEQAITIMRGNVQNFSCRSCPSTSQAETGDNDTHECSADNRQVRFKYIFNEDVDYYNGDGTFSPNGCNVTPGTVEQEAVETTTCTYTAGNAANAASCDVFTGSGSCSVGNDQYSVNDILSNGATSVCDEGYFPYRGPKYDYCKPCSTIYEDNHPSSLVAQQFCQKGDLSSDGDITLLSSTKAMWSDTTYDNISSQNATPSQYDPYITPPGSDASPKLPVSFATRVNNGPVDELKLFDFGSLPTDDSVYGNIKKYWDIYFKANFVDDIDDQTDQITLNRTEDEFPFTATNLSQLTKADLLNRERLSVGDQPPLEICADQYTTPTFEASCTGTVTAGGTDCATIFASADNNLAASCPAGCTFNYVGTCETCTNTISQIVDGDPRLTGTSPIQPGSNKIIKHLRSGTHPICSMDAEFFNETFNEGNIIDVHNGSGTSCSDASANCCEEGYKYTQQGIWSHGHIKCIPEESSLVSDCSSITDEHECNKSIQPRTPPFTPPYIQGVANPTPDAYLTMCKYNPDENQCQKDNVLSTNPINFINIFDGGDETCLDMLSAGGRPWEDSGGDDCSAYTEGAVRYAYGNPAWCQDPDNTDEYAVNGVSATDACCRCGGGSSGVADLALSRAENNSYTEASPDFQQDAAKLFGSDAVGLDFKYIDNRRFKYAKDGCPSEPNKYTPYIRSSSDISSPSPLDFKICELHESAPGGLPALYAEPRPSRGSVTGGILISDATTPDNVNKKADLAGKGIPTRINPLNSKINTVGYHEEGDWRIIPGSDTCRPGDPLLWCRNDDNWTTTTSEITTDCGSYGGHHIDRCTSHISSRAWTDNHGVPATVACPVACETCCDAVPTPIIFDSPSSNTPHDGNDYFNYGGMRLPADEDFFKVMEDRQTRQSYTTTGDGYNGFAPLIDTVKVTDGCLQEGTQSVCTYTDKSLNECVETCLKVENCDLIKSTIHADYTGTERGTCDLYKWNMLCPWNGTEDGDREGRYSTGYCRRGGRSSTHSITQSIRAAEGGEETIRNYRLSGTPPALVPSNYPQTADLRPSAGTITIEVPMDASPGDIIQVGSGRDAIEIELPDGAVAGSTLEVQRPKFSENPLLGKTIGHLRDWESFDKTGNREWFYRVSGNPHLDSTYQNNSVVNQYGSHSAPEDIGWSAREIDLSKAQQHVSPLVGARQLWAPDPNWSDREKWISMNKLRKWNGSTWE